MEGWELNKLKKNMFLQLKEGKGELSLSLSLSACTSINGSVNDIKFISDLYNVVLSCMHIFTCTCIFRVIIKINFNTHDCVKRIFPKKAYFLSFDQRAGIIRVYIFEYFLRCEKKRLLIIRIFIL